MFQTLFRGTLLKTSIRFNSFTKSHIRFLSVNPRNAFISASTSIPQVPQKSPIKTKKKKLPVDVEFQSKQDASKAVAFCTAEGYIASELLSLLQRNYILLPFIADDVYHIRIQNPKLIAEEMSDPLENSNDPEAFVFLNGTFATWGASDKDNEDLIKKLKTVEINKYNDVESELFDYVVDEDAQTGLFGETIVIGSDVPQHQAKLAFSAGVTRSVKLASLEERLDEHLDKNRHIPEILLKGKRLPLGRPAVLRNIGELFSLRGHLNLHSELLDSPDFCWSHSKNGSKMEDYFDRISRNLDIRPRIAVFNKKLDYANELSEVLRNHLHEKQSLKLEWIIIVLITIEIMFECLHYAERWYVSKE